MVTIETRVLGKKNPLIPQRSIPVESDPGSSGDDGLTLRQFIERVVRTEVAAFAERQESRKFVRALSEGDIEKAAARGKVESGGNEHTDDVDVDRAIGTALMGFEDGLYLVLIDGEEQRDLDKQIWVSDDTSVVFLRLTFLAGA